MLADHELLLTGADTTLAMQSDKVNTDVGA